MGKFCLYCEKPMREMESWTGLFHYEPKHLCKECQEGLLHITGKRCVQCSRSLEKLPGELVRGDICLDCQRWEEDSEWKGVLSTNTSLFEYNPFLKVYLARYKYRGDHILAQAFSNYIKKSLNSIEFDFIVAIPLSEERHYERGFNQSTAFLEAASVTPSNILTRAHTEKQSKKPRQERLHQKQVFTLTECNLTNKNILLFDDIYTTGITLRLAAILLKQAGAKQVSSLTLARG
ncbi:ComF family protein [Rossellomorea aquimaris]|uniref:ComF family protein n=1 Tax=Rossellomorea aquimaris TaxID=189382 RepID=UPI001CD7C0D4|nr:ComF family protein [Rossellomorea aquimaris]MCA1055290.1 ComF family protein [Rossellomorea aquimaris]